MVEELKLAIKVDDDAIEQSLLKQFANAEKMANKVVLTFNNIDLDDKVIEAKFKEMQKMAGKNPIDLSIDKSSIEMLSAISKQLGNIFDIAKGKSIIDSSATTQIDKLQSKLDELTKKYNELSSKKIGSTVSGKDIDLVNNEEFKSLSENFEKIKRDIDELRTHMSLLDDYTVDSDSFLKLETQVDGLSVKIDDLIGKYIELSNVQKNIGTDKSNILSGTQINDVFQGDKIDQATTSAKELDKTLEQVDIPTDSFDDVLSKLDLTESKLKEIVKITKQSVSDSEGKFHDSYTLKDKRGSTEIYGLSSNTEKGQLLRSNIVEYDAKAAEQEAKAVKEVWDKNVKAIQDYMDAVTKLNNLNAKDKGTGKYSSQIALQEKNVEELKEKALEARTAITSMIDPHDIPLNTWRDYLDVMKKFDQASLGSAESVAKLEDALRKMDFSSLESAGTKFDSQFKNLSIKPDGDHQFLSWTNDLKELNIKIDEYSSKVKYLKENNIVDGEQVDEVKKLRDEIEETINVMTKTPQAKRGWTDIGASKAAEKVANVLKQNTKMSKEAKDAIRAYYNELRSGNPSQPIDEILVKVNQLVQKERELGRVGKSFGEIFKEKVIYGGAAQLAGMVGFYDVINGIRECITTVRELDTALTEMRKVSDEGLASLKNYQNISFDVADEIGSTALALQDATATWMRLGESLSEASESAKDATILMNVSEFESIDEATDSLVSMSQAFKELDKMEIIDVLDKIGNEYSISTDNLSRALQDSAAVLKTQGNDLYESVALITAGNAINQDYSKTAGGVRTISLRLAGTEEAKEELSSLGEDVDDFIVQTNSKTQELIKDYTAVASNAYKGIDVLDANGNLRNTYNILLDISKIYKEIQEEDKKAGTNRAQALVEYIAGKNRSNIASSILLNPELLESVYESAKNADGAAMKELDVYMESLDAKVAQFQNRLQELESDLVNSDFLKGAIDFGTEFIHILDEIINKFGVLPTIMTGVGAGLAVKNVGVA